MAEWEGNDRGRDAWMASPTQWTWVWVNSGRQWRTGKPDMLQYMESQRLGHDCVTERQQQNLLYNAVWFPPYIDMNQPQVHICSLPREPPSYIPPHPAPLGRCRPPGWALYVIQWLPISHPFYMWWSIYFNASLSVLPALSCCSWWSYNRCVGDGQRSQPCYSP